jgi:hypothetical protein
MGISESGTIIEKMVPCQVKFGKSSHFDPAGAPGSIFLKITVIWTSYRKNGVRTG